MAVPTAVETYAGIEYADGRRLDVHRPEGVHDGATVLLWHGSGPDERDVLAPLGRRVAAAGVVVIVPDWRSDAADGGRGDLLGSLRWARSHAAEHGGHTHRIVLAGWSLGARAAAGVVTRPEVVGGWRPRALVGLAASYDEPAPITGSTPLEDLGRTPPLATWLVHGTRDEVVAPEGSRRLAAALVDAGWPVRFTEPVTDHAGVIGTRYDRGRRLCVADAGEHARVGLEASARALIAATLPEADLGIHRVG